MRLAAIIKGDGGILPTAVRELARLLLAQIAGLAEKIADLDAELRKRVTTDDTARRLLARKPKMLVAVALANRMTRTAWALLHKGEDYRDLAMSVA